MSSCGPVLEQARPRGLSNDRPTEHGDADTELIIGAVRMQIKIMERHARTPARRAQAVAGLT